MTDGFAISTLYPNNKKTKVGLYPLGGYQPGLCRAREPMVPQTYMRFSKATSFMNRDTDSQSSWLRDPLTGVWHKRSQAGGRDFLPSGADVHRGDVHLHRGGLRQGLGQQAPSRRLAVLL